MVLAVWIVPALAGAPGEGAGPAELAAALGGEDAVAEAASVKRLLALREQAVPALLERARPARPAVARLLAVELLGRIGTAAALDGLLGLLPPEKDLSVRGQICMQLGYARHAPALPAILEYLSKVAPGTLRDVAGGKEMQPSTCCIRHVEALAMIGDQRAAAALEALAKRIPAATGGGFLEAFISGAIADALADLKDRQAFEASLSRHPGLAEKVATLFAHFRSDPVARYRLYEDEVVRRTPRGREIVRELTSGADAAVASAAKELLSHYDSLGK